MRGDRPDLARRLVAEAVGTALLLATVVGSGIMGERLSGGNVAVALLANTLATGAALVALILTFGPISGAHFNPAVTLADASQGGLPWGDVPGYVAVQIVGAFAGVLAAHTHVRAAGLLRLAPRAPGARADVQRVRGHLRSARRHLGLRPAAARPRCPSRWPRTSRRPTGSRRPRPSRIPPSRSPARRATRSRASGRPMSRDSCVAQLVGAAAATALFRWLVPPLPVSADAVAGRQ